MLEADIVTGWRHAPVVTAAWSVDDAFGGGGAFDGFPVGREPGRCRILIVEDEAIIAWQLAEMVEQLGYEVSGTVASEEEAVQAAVDTRPDLILMDVRLRGGGDGISAAETIRRHSHVPIVFCTAYATDMPLRGRMNAVGAAGVLSKPTAFEALKNTLGAVLEPPTAS